jgi:hypothetical protein
MADVLLVNFEGEVRGVCRDFGDAIECLFKLNFPNRPIPSVEWTDLQGTAVEGSKHDLMVRELAKLKDSTFTVTSHTLGSTPCTDRDYDREIPFYRDDNPTSALQQAVYDLADGYDFHDTQTRLVEDLEEMLPPSGSSMDECLKFLTNARTSSEAVGSAFRDRLVGKADQVSRRDVNYFIGRMVENALTVIEENFAPSAAVKQTRRHRM